MKLVWQFSYVVNASDKYGTDDDYAAELLQEPGESKGQQVYRYLKTVVAWHSAVFHLTNDARVPKLLESVEIGIVEVPPSPSSVLSVTQVSEALFARFPYMTEFSEKVQLELTKRHSDKFGGRVHAEAALMGLVNYYAYETTYRNRSAAVTDEEHMRNIVQPVRCILTFVDIDHRDTYNRWRAQATQLLLLVKSAVGVATGLVITWKRNSSFQDHMGSCILGIHRRQASGLPSCSSWRRSCGASCVKLCSNQSPTHLPIPATVLRQAHPEAHPLL